jgi:FtsH-binding integral membrane protein
VPSSRPTGLIIGSLLCSVVALGIVPLLFGSLAIFLGYRAYHKDAAMGRACMFIGGAALIIGVVVGAVWGMENLNL